MDAGRLVDGVGVDRVDLIKCDVWGAEELVFAGAARTLERWRPAVICEIEQRQLVLLPTEQPVPTRVGLDVVATGSVQDAPRFGRPWYVEAAHSSASQ